MNRSKIMRNAWAAYRFQLRYRDDQKFDRSLFGEMLRREWASAKADCASAIERAVEAARLAAAEPCAARAAAIRTELHDMELVSDFIDWGRRSSLGAELAKLSP